ncbi:hypothetical protein O6H91_04G122200 [Diphasiastrum complanatum]|uniref:Uncharacterized protein n=2 Tax=Diphasiastrum complanatum TaxID=34168 RepID=A0ACC2E1E2_DIPCM|nr:hypothetical protein O6H91_04G122200 [Diphasiastrum complanatum]KAJ7560292.1 hypothetical protein O6H91_04G122200 [Diphasiastrum complanatum]
MAECCDPLLSQFDSVTMPDFSMIPGCQDFEKTIMGSRFDNISGGNTISIPDTNEQTFIPWVLPKPEKELSSINHVAATSRGMVSIPVVNSNGLYFCGQTPVQYSGYSQPSLEPEEGCLDLPIESQSGFFMQENGSSTLGSSLSKNSDELGVADSMLSNSPYYVQPTQFREELLDWISDARVSSIGGASFTPENSTPRNAKMTRSLSAPIRSSRMIFNRSDSFVVDNHSYLSPAKEDMSAGMNGSARHAASLISPLKRSLEANAPVNLAAVSLESQIQGNPTEETFQQQAFAPCNSSWIRSSVNEVKLLSNNNKESIQMSASPKQQSLRRRAVLNKSLSGSALLQPRSYAPPPTISEATPFPHMLRSNFCKIPNNSLTTQVPLVQPEIQDEITKLGISGMRRSQSTDDLQNLPGAQTNSAGSSPMTLDCTNNDEAVKIGRYTTEERKIRICRYRQKRTERNYDKKIKYACRKTLADNRLRVKGRFAKTEVMEDLQEKLLENQQECEDKAREALLGGESYICYQYAFGVDLSEIWKLPLSTYVEI